MQNMCLISDERAKSITNIITNVLSWTCKSSKLLDVLPHSLIEGHCQNICQKQTIFRWSMWWSKRDQETLSSLLEWATLAHWLSSTVIHWNTRSWTHASMRRQPVEKIGYNFYFIFIKNRVGIFVDKLIDSSNG